MRLNVRKSITFKLTLLFASASTVVLLLLGYLIGASVEQHFEEQDMEVLTGKLQLARHALEKVRTARELDVLPQQLEDSLVGHHGLVVVVLAPDGQTLFATSGADFPQTLLDERRPADATRPTVWKTSDGRPLRGISATVAMGSENRPQALVAVGSLRSDVTACKSTSSRFRFSACDSASSVRPRSCCAMLRSWTTRRNDSTPTMASAIALASATATTPRFCASFLRRIAHVEYECALTSFPVENRRRSSASAVAFG